MQKRRKNEITLIDLKYSQVEKFDFKRQFSADVKSDDVYEIFPISLISLE